MTLIPEWKSREQLHCTVEIVPGEVYAFFSVTGQPSMHMSVQKLRFETERI